MMHSFRELRSTSIDEENFKENMCFVFGLKEKIGALATALKIFEENNINLIHIESRLSKLDKQKYEFFVECKAKCKVEFMRTIECLKEQATYLQIYNKQQVSSSSPIDENETPWFPRKIKELDQFAHRVMNLEPDIDPTDPLFTDPAYRERRQIFNDIAKNYKHGQPIPKVDYTPDEIKTWGVIFRSMTKLYPTHACEEYNRVFNLLIQNCGYREDNIPQLEDVSRFLKDCTGFTLRPVSGILSSRDFLAGLAFRVFHSTQYIRHHSVPTYTQEPDICHELLGHAPLFADPDFAELSQEIGLASLGVSDEYIKKLTGCYWYTVEFGLCKQNGKIKAFGAGLLSSIAELQYCLTDQPELKPFDPEKAAIQEFPLTKYQPVYFVSESFKQAKESMSQFAKNIPRPFSIRYNPYTQSIETINNKDKLFNLVREVKNEITILEDALNKLDDVKLR